MGQEIAVKATYMTRLIKPYAEQMGYSRDFLTIIQGEDPIGNTGFRSIMLKKERKDKLLCWFLQSDGSGFKAGDLQTTMTYQPEADNGIGLLFFETIETFKYPSKKKNEYWLPLKPADQLKNLKLANECLGIVKIFRSGTE